MCVGTNLCKHIYLIVQNISVEKSVHRLSKAHPQTAQHSKLQVKNSLAIHPPAVLMKTFLLSTKQLKETIPLNKNGKIQTFPTS